MGMFDYVRCEYPLPDRPEWAEEDFQTKDLDCQMDHYVITADGELRRDHWNRERKTYDRDPAVEDYTGSINFYCMSDSRRRRWDEYWLEYIALFDRGRLLLLRQTERKEPKL